MIKLPAPAGSVVIAPSILSADLLNLDAQVKLAQDAGADWLHIDVMDGHFVPNLSFGPATVSAVNKIAAVPQDVHLMVQQPQNFIAPFIKAGASALTLHIEAQGDIKTLLSQIKRQGLSAGLSIKPDTSPRAIMPYIDLLDIVLVMTVYPGFGGQGFLENGPEQIQAVRQIIDDSARKIWLEVDGGINRETIITAVRSGADALVAGNAVFGAENPAQAIEVLRENAIIARKDL